MEAKTVPVYFGGEAHELWTSDGLHVTYTGRLAVLACRDSRGGWRASAPDPEHFGNVKLDYNKTHREQELAMRLDSGLTPALTSAYFRASATASEALELCGDDVRMLSQYLPNVISDGEEAIILLELLRLLLDENRLSWSNATSIISHVIVCRPIACTRHPLSAVAALQPRDASIIKAVNNKLCEALWRAYPGDWPRICSGAVISDGEVDFGKLCAAMCGRIICSRALIAGQLRTLYSIMPEKFEDNI